MLRKIRNATFLKNDSSQHPHGIPHQFGPFTICDAVKKRTTSKAYGMIFNCIGTRAVYLDLVPDYSTESFLMMLRRFVSFR